MTDKSLEEPSPEVMFRCACGTYDHLVMVTYDAEYDEYYLYCAMDSFLPWYKRLYHAARYILGMKPTAYHFGETCIQGESFRSKMAVFDKEVLDAQNTRNDDE